MVASDRNYTLKETSQLFVNFPLTCLKKLKFLEARKKLFYLKYSFCLPVDSAVPGRLHHSLPPPSYAPLVLFVGLSFPDLSCGNRMFV